MWKWRFKENHPPSSPPPTGRDKSCNKLDVSSDLSRFIGTQTISTSSIPLIYFGHNCLARKMMKVKPIIPKMTLNLQIVFYPRGQLYVPGFILAPGQMNIWSMVEIIIGIVSIFVAEWQMGSVWGGILQKTATPVSLNLNEDQFHYYEPIHPIWSFCFLQQKKTWAGIQSALKVGIYFGIWGFTWP